MAYVIYLICCGIHGVLMYHLDISWTQWEYWALYALIIVSWICGREWGERNG